MNNETDFEDGLIASVVDLPATVDLEAGNPGEFYQTNADAADEITPTKFLLDDLSSSAEPVAEKPIGFVQQLLHLFGRRAATPGVEECAAKSNTVKSKTLSNALPPVPPAQTPESIVLLPSAVSESTTFLTVGSSNASGSGSGGVGGFFHKLSFHHHSGGCHHHGAAGPQHSTASVDQFPGNFNTQRSAGLGLSLAKELPEALPVDAAIAATIEENSNNEPYTMEAVTTIEENDDDVQKVLDELLDDFRSERMNALGVRQLEALREMHHRQLELSALYMSVYRSQMRIGDGAATRARFCVNTAQPAAGGEYEKISSKLDQLHDLMDNYTLEKNEFL